MNSKSALCILFAIISTSAYAQLYYRPVEINLPSEVNPNNIGESFAFGDGVIYVGGFGFNSDMNPTVSGVYSFNASSLDYIQTYNGPGDRLLDFFGNDVEYHNGKVLASSPGILSDAGAFLYDANTGALLHRFYESANAFGASAFASDASINDLAIIIGGVNYNMTGQVFVYNAVNNNLLVTIDPPADHVYDTYGFQVDHNNEYLVVSSPGDTFFGDAGVVYVYDFSSGELLHTLTSPNTHPNQNFGFSIDLDGSKLLVGSLNSTSFIDPSFGEAHLFDLNTGELSQTIYSNSEFDRFGFSVSLDGDTAVVGAPDDYVFGVNAGAVYVFDLKAKELVEKVFTFPTPGSNRFGRTVRAKDGVILATRREPGGDQNSSIYQMKQFCRQDINFDGSVDFFDISDFIAQRYDWNFDAEFDFFDISSYLQAFLQTCP